MNKTQQIGENKLVNNFTWSLLGSQSEVTEEYKTPEIRINNTNFINSDCLSISNREGAKTLMEKGSKLDPDQEDNSDDTNTNSFDSESMEWRLGDFINKGSIGEVFRALDWNSAKLIAIKFIDCNDLSTSQTTELLYQLKDKINKIKEVKDQNIIRYLTVSEEEGEEDK